jgi:hypothetical protein
VVALSFETRRFAPLLRMRGQSSSGPAAGHYNPSKQKAGIAPGLSFFVSLRRKAQFAEARFGGEAGHDLIRVS